MKISQEQAHRLAAVMVAVVGVVREMWTAMVTALRRALDLLKGVAVQLQNSRVRTPVWVRPVWAEGRR